MKKLYSRSLTQYALTVFLSLCLLFAASITQQVQATGKDKVKFRRIPIQYIASLGDPQASSGDDAQTWGLWRIDPGPRGVWLKNYAQLEATDGVTPAKWQFDKKEWWVDENGLLMEKPDFPVAPGKYVVTGDREMVSVLTIHPDDANGNRRWELDFGASLYDVTHLPCRSARYTSASGDDACSPSAARLNEFPVTPGGVMPSIQGCNKQDFSVLFVIGMAVDS